MNDIDDIKIIIDDDLDNNMDTSGINIILDEEIKPTPKNEEIIKQPDIKFEKKTEAPVKKEVWKPNDSDDSTINIIEEEETWDDSHREKRRRIRRRIIKSKKS